MAVHFTQDFIDELLKKVDLMDLMGRHGVSVKAGTGNNHYYIADFCCGKKDYGNGRIKKSTQTYKCLACNTGGNAIHFLREVVGMSFQEAIQELAAIAQMELPVEDAAVKEEQRRKSLALKLAAEFYHEQNNYDYFISRGLSHEVLTKAKAGYAPGGRALRSFLEQHGFTKDELKEYKLINHKGLDAFFYRAVIPIYMYGKVTDLYGRAVDDSKSGVKHFYLYGNDILGGFDQLDPEKLVKLYESAIDRLVAESHGIDNGVDSGGAKRFTADHARQLRKKGVNRMLIIYDGDKAGREGALKTGDLLVNEGIKVWIAELPEDMDPARIIQEKGKESFLEAITGSKTFEQFKMYQELAQYDLKDIEEYVAEMKKRAGTKERK